MSESTDHDFEQEIARDLEQLTHNREMIKVELTPAMAFMLLAQLQLALRHHSNTGAAADFARAFAHSLQERISTTPALAELCVRGWTDDA